MNRTLHNMQVLTASLLLLLPATLRAADRPNIIVILADDMGWSDLSCYGSEIPTPNLDKLAGNGLKFTQFYNTGRCCPTRASLLTGLYAHQAGIGAMEQNWHLPGYQGFINDRCATIAEVLRPAGYFTIMSGKWHVGGQRAREVSPKNRGFDRSLWSKAGGFYFPDSPRTDLWLNEENVGRRGGQLPDDWYVSDLWTDFGIKFIDEALAAKKLFYLHLCHIAPHFPLQAPAEDIAKFRGKYKAGWDKLREQRHARQKEMGVVDPAWPLSPRPDKVKAWDSLTAAEQDRFDHMMAIYAACVSRMDASVGRLVEALQKRGILDNTVIFFLSDNGGNAEAGPNGKFDGKIPGSAEFTTYCGQSWATLENTPFRLYKHYNHEGGIATPLIVHWPVGIKAHGELRQQPGHIIDIMPTCAELAGAKYPGAPILPMEGKSLVPAFANKPVERDALYWEHEGNAAVRVGDWKLVRLGYGGAWELYDLAKDRTELHNLAAEQPERVKELRTKWDAWAARCNVALENRNPKRKAAKANAQ